MSEDGYPTDEDLKIIKEWPSNDFTGLIEYLQDIFWNPDWCITVKGKKVLSVWISTAGWSGNDEIMSALEENFIFWSVCWISVRRGGHYFFKVKNIKV